MGLSVDTFSVLPIILGSTCDGSATVNALFKDLVFIKLGKTFFLSNSSFERIGAPGVLQMYHQHLHLYFQVSSCLLDVCHFYKSLLWHARNSSGNTWMQRMEPCHQMAM